MSDIEFYTAEELIEKFPHIERWGWSSKLIITLYKAGCVSGYFSGSEKRVLICLESFTKLLRHINSVKEDNKIDL